MQLKTVEEVIKPIEPLLSWPSNQEGNESIRTVYRTITQDRADMRAVLRQSVIETRRMTSHIYQVTEIGRLDEAEIKGYNKCIDDILTLIDTLLPGDVSK